MLKKSIGDTPLSLGSLLKSNLFRLIAGVIVTIILIAIGLKYHIMPLQMLGSPWGRAVEASDGKWAYDLRDYDLNGVYAALHGNYYYPQQYVMPEDIDRAPPVYLPPETVIPDDYMTQRFIILLPDDGQVYRLQFFNPSLSVYINGKLAGQNGNPGLNWDENELNKQLFSCYVTPENGIIDVITQTSVWNLYDDRAFRIVPYLSYPELDYVHPYGPNHLTYIFMGGLFGAAVLLVFMFFANRKWRGNLYFAAACVAMGIIYGSQGQHDHLIDVFSSMSGKTAFYLGLLSLPVMAVCVLAYLDRVFPKTIPKWLPIGFAGLSAGFAGVTLFTDPRFSTWLAVYYRAGIGVILLAFVVMLVLRLRKPTADQYVSLYGMIVLLIAAANDILLHHDLFSLMGTSADVTPLSMLVFVLAQLVSLYLGNHRMTMAAREAERKLAEDNEALDRLNRLKTEFLGNVSHELKTPLAVMLGVAQNARRELETRDKGAAQQHCLGQYSQFRK